MKKLLLIGSNKSVHFKNFYQLIKDYFDEIIIITDCKNYELSEKINLVSFSLKNPIEILKTCGAIKSIIKQEKPDIIHIQQANSVAFLSLLGRGDIKIPAVVTAWGGDILDNPKENFILNYICKYILRKGNYFTSDSLYMAYEMQKIISKKLDITIANFGADIKYSEEFLKENIVYSNRLHQDLYRIDLIIKGFKKFIENRKDSWKLVIAGEGYATDKLKRLVKTLNLEHSVEFVGWLNKTENDLYYNKSRIFVSLPNTDATSISLLEAMAAGCIPVLSNLPANLEWVIDRHNGIIVSNEDENFIEKALALNPLKVKEINHSIVSLKATKEVNKNLFTGLYDKIYKSLI
jgi:L-malate glycosyltransferase